MLPGREVIEPVLPVVAVVSPEDHPHAAIDIVPEELAPRDRRKHRRHHITGGRAPEAPVSKRIDPGIGCGGITVFVRDDAGTVSPLYGNIRDKQLAEHGELRKRPLDKDAVLFPRHGRDMAQKEAPVKASYLLEISNEIGKLSSGASGSVQQLSDSAKEDWKKVHDVNLSMKDIMQIVNATRDQANMRMSTWRQAKEEVRSQIKNVGIPSVPEAQPFNVTIPGGIDPQAIANELAKRLKRR